MLYEVLLNAYHIISQYHIFMRCDMAYDIIKPLKYYNVSILLSLAFQGD